MSAPALATPTMVGILRARALEAPGRTAFTFLADGDGAEQSVTYGALDEQVRAIAAWLQREGLAGERALLLFPPGLEFVAAFFACLYAGVVAVPAYPPRRNRPDARLQQITSDARAKLVLSTAEVVSDMQAGRAETPGMDGLRWQAVDEVPLELAAAWREPSVGAADLAFLQYTSGSTVAPKGVMVSHANILHNSEQLDLVGRHRPDGIGISWLPHFHDMGLIYGVVQPVYGGFPCYLMSPASFLQRPLRWLETISRYRATYSGGPNFAYELCTARIGPEQREALDLSSWRVAFNGAEPIRPATLERFAETFAPCGFRREALSPAYGLAESTLMVSISAQGAPPVFYRVDANALERHRVEPASEGDAGARTLVGCGRFDGMAQVAIVDPESRRPCAPDQVGEIWVSGRSVAMGYWDRAEETAQTFGASLAGDGERRYLRTGDLGFVADSELFVTGRIKEMILIRGLNHYPQDIEQTVQASHAALKPGAGAAFSVDADGDERLVVVQEVERTQRNADLDEVVRAIRRRVTDEHEIEPWAVSLLSPGSILKTSSGKIQRGACRTAFLAGALKSLHSWQRPAESPIEPPAEPPAAGPRSEADITAWLLSRLARETGIDADEIDLGQPFASLGIDSARALILVGDLETWLGRRLPPIVLWNYPTIEALARHLAN